MLSEDRYCVRCGTWLGGYCFDGKPLRCSSCGYSGTSVTKANKFLCGVRDEDGREHTPAERNGEDVPVEPSLDGLAGERILSRRQMLRLTGGAIAGLGLAGSFVGSSLIATNQAIAQGSARIGFISRTDRVLRVNEG